jgi:manganese/zinc/iron transport system substrate-binding protein
MHRLIPLAIAPVRAVAGAPPAAPAGADLADRTIRVVTTTGMVADLVENVGGERVEVTGLMGPGVDPHLYKPSAGDIRRLESADIVFYNGLELEGRMTDLFVKMARAGKPTVAVGEAIDPSRLRQPPEFEGRFDPHVWFDPVLWRETIPAVREGLAGLDPGSGPLYQANADRYARRLDDLHAYVQQQVGQVPPAGRVLITAHDAFGYFGERYGFEVRGLQGVSTATEAGAADVQALAGFIATRRIKALFVESSVPRATIEAVQAAVRARGWDVAIGRELFSDALGAAGTPEGTYVGMVRHNVDAIVEALA